MGVAVGKQALEVDRNQVACYDGFSFGAIPVDGNIVNLTRAADGGGEDYDIPDVPDSYRPVFESAVALTDGYANDATPEDGGHDSIGQSSTRRGKRRGRRRTAFDVAGLGGLRIESNV